MGVYNDLLYPFPCGGDEEKKTDSKIINEILKQIKELQGKITELEKAMASLEKDTSRAKQEAEQALATAQLALSNMQAMLAQIEAINDKATQADNKATQALNSINDIRTEISIIARVADNAINAATEAINKANQAQLTAEQADATATDAKQTAEEAIDKSPVIIDVATTPWYDIYDATTTRKTLVVNGLKTLLGLGRDKQLIPIDYEYQTLSARTEFVFISYTTGTFNTIFPKLFIVYARQDYQQASGPAVWSLANSVTLQKELVSGTSIKTINNQSLLGNGNIDIPTGSLPELELGTAIQIATYKEGANRYKVLQKVIDLGALPNSTSKTVAHGIDKTKVLKYLSIQGSASQEGFGNTLPLPCVTIGSESVNNNIYVSVGGNNITIATGRDRTAYTGTLTITYIDNTPIS